MEQLKANLLCLKQKKKWEKALHKNDLQYKETRRIYKIINARNIYNTLVEMHYIVTFRRWEGRL